jgi:hypothetical protein
MPINDIDTLCKEIALQYAFEFSGLITNGNGQVLLARFFQKKSLCLEFEMDRGRQQARLEDFQVAYGSVCQRYSMSSITKQGQVEQFSPFDDGPPWHTEFSVEEWSLRILNHYLEKGSLGYVQ